MAWSFFLIVVIAVIVGYLCYLQPWRRPAPANVSNDLDPKFDFFKTQQRGRVRQMQVRRKQAFTAVLVGVLVGSVLLLFVPHERPAKAGRAGDYEAMHSPEVPNRDGGPGADGARTLDGGRGSSVGTALWAVAIMGCVAIAAGVILLVAGPNTSVRWAGAASLMAGLSANGYLVNEVKIGELIKVDAKVDGIALNVDLAWKAKLKELSAFGSERLVELDGFEPGQADLRPGMGEKIDALCGRWNQPEQIQRPGLLLIAGSTDRVPLSAALRKRYESNVGLARARAEKVRERMLACLTSEAPVLTVTTGPVHTPALKEREVADGAGQDRSVVVWALWNVPQQKK